MDNRNLWDELFFQVCSHKKWVELYNSSITPTLPQYQQCDHRHDHSLKTKVCAICEVEGNICKRKKLKYNRP